MPALGLLPPTMARLHLSLPYIKLAFHLTPGPTSKEQGWESGPWISQDYQLPEENWKPEEAGRSVGSRVRLKLGRGPTSAAVGPTPIFFTANRVAVETE